MLAVYTSRVSHPTPPPIPRPFRLYTASLRLSEQGATPPKPSPAAVQPQLNPNSVAARRLASRKGLSSAQQAGAVGAGSAALPPPSSEQAPVGAASAGSRQKCAAVAGSGAGEAVDGTGGCDPDPDPDGWSNFAAFDQFPASELSASGRDGSFGASLEAPATASAAAGALEGKSRDAAEARESPLLDLAQHGGGTGRLDRNGGGGGGAVAALGDQLAGVSFPSTARMDQQQQMHQKVVRVLPAGEWGEAGGSSLNATVDASQQAWLTAPSTGQVLAGQTMSGPGGNGFAATFPRLGSGGIVVASGSSQQQRQEPQQQQQQERQQSSPSSSPPPPAAAAGRVAGSPPPAGQPPQPLAQTQVSQPRWPSPQKHQQWHQQWQPGNPVTAGWNGGSATWAAGMGQGPAQGGSPPVLASPPRPVLQGQPSSAGRSMSGSWASGNNGTGGVAAVANGGGAQVSGSPVRQQQPYDVRLFSGSPPPTQYPDAGEPW